MAQQVLHTWRELAKMMIETNELDPTYGIVRHLAASRDKEWFGRFLTHYLCFYNLKYAIEAADKTDDEKFWDHLYHQGQTNYVQRRGARRHFRADNAHKAVVNMKAKAMAPHVFLDALYQPIYPRLVKNVEQNFPNMQIGPYYRWKLMDWFDICMGKPVDITIGEAIRYLPPKMKEDAEIYFPGLRFGEVMERVTMYIAQFPHPVKPFTACGPAEAETVICGLSAYYGNNQRFPLGENIEEQYPLVAVYPELAPYAPARCKHLYKCGEYRYEP
jgi:hypothetical protein